MFVGRTCRNEMTGGLSPTHVPYAMSLTCVTAIFNIGRDAIDGRTISDYKQWLIATLATINCPFFLCLDASLGWKQDLLESAKGPLHIVEMKLEEVSMYPYKRRIEAILQNPAWKEQQTRPQDITNRLAEYCMIQYSKFGFVERAIQENMFGTQYFAWMDAGLSRFFDATKTYLFAPRIPLQPTMYVQGETRELSRVTNSIIGTNRCLVKGTLWIVEQQTFQHVKQEVLRILETEMLDKDRFDNEQIAMALAIRSHPNRYTILEGRNHIRTLFDAFFYSNY